MAKLVKSVGIRPMRMVIEDSPYRALRMAIARWLIRLAYRIAQVSFVPVEKEDRSERRRMGREQWREGAL